MEKDRERKGVGKVIRHIIELNNSSKDSNAVIETLDFRFGKSTCLQLHFVIPI
jgi:hypothetical protein